MVILGHQAIECTWYAGCCSHAASGTRLAQHCESAIARKRVFDISDDPRRLCARADAVSMGLKGASTALWDLKMQSMWNRPAATKTAFAIK